MPGTITLSCACCNPPVTVGCCGVTVSRTLYAHFSNAAGCACLDGLVVTLTWDGFSVWGGNTSIPGCCSSCTVTITFNCQPAGTSCNNFSMQVNCGFNAQNNTHSVSACSCTPFSVAFNGFSFTAPVGTKCCAGTVNITVLSTP